MARYLIGELFDQEEIKEKTKFQNMKAKDDKGHMRWEGAFTGGFTAGYKNTCGSKDGWAPTTFFSSRDKRAQAVSQEIHSFMDTEDIGKSKIEENIQIQSQFQPSNSLLKIGLQQSVGQDMLANLRKLKAQQDQPHNQQDLRKLLQRYSKADEIRDTQFQHFSHKQDFTTLGYAWDCDIEDEFITHQTELFMHLLNNREKEETEEEKRKKKEDNKIYFDYTKPLEEEHDYLKEIVDTTDTGPTKKRKLEITSYHLKDLFTKASSVKQNEKVSQYPSVPKDYDPYRRMKEYAERTGSKRVEAGKHKLTTEERNKILGERTLQFYKEKNENDYIKGTEQELGGNFEMQYFLMDPEKQKRYQQYVMEQEGKYIPCDDVGGFAWEKVEQEREVFETLYQKSLQKGNTARNALAQAQKKKPKQKEQVSIVGRADRTKREWRPEKTLCKRFNVLMPYTVRRHD